MFQKLEGWEIKSHIGGGVRYYAFSVQIFPRSFGCANFTQIDQILSM